MHVALNALDLFPGRAGGIETYFRNLLAALEALPAAGDRYTLLALRPNGAGLRVTNPAFRIREYACGRPSAGWLLRRSVRRLTGLDVLAPAIRRLPVDVVHHPFTTVNTPGLTQRSVLTFHDMQHEFIPEMFSPAELRWRRRAYPASARSVTRVIAISGHVKATLVERYGLDPARVDVVYNGCGPEFRPAGDGEPPDEVPRRLGLARPFLYYPAASWPHKNHARLLAAFRLLLDRGRFDGDLALSGIAREAHGAVGAEIERLRLRDRVKLLGYLPAGELPALYRAAELLVFPSLFEGFGIPLVEAMACGCPVACARAAALPEIAGDAALLFDPRSPEDIAARVAEVLEGGAIRRRLRAAGLARAAEFRWERAARETVAVYRRALAAVDPVTRARWPRRP